ncbi:MAG: response regulator [Planctomycetales bacterium]|nr:response regulator [Planctomycetales bacterium]
MSKILVVDDSPVERQMIVGLLSSNEGLQVEAVGSGSEALQHIRDSRPDLVISDMEMPQIDGLELLKQIRVHHADLPVIVITSLGSEAMAVEALHAGAASYLAKTNIEESLFETVQQVLTIVEANRNSSDLMSCLRETYFEFEIASDPELIEPLVQLVLNNLGGMRLQGKTDTIQMGVALEQALLNAIYRGNLEITPDQLEAARERQLLGIDVDPVAERRREAPYADRKIQVQVSLTPHTAKLVVRDEGPGFDVSRFHQLTELAGPERETDRGLLLMKNLMDEVMFNEQGNEVTLIKHLANGRDR